MQRREPSWMQRDWSNRGRRRAREEMNMGRGVPMDETGKDVSVADRLNWQGQKDVRFLQKEKICRQLS